MRKVVRSKTGYFFWLTEARLTAWLTTNEAFYLYAKMVRSEVRTEKAILFVVLMKIAYTVLTWKEKQPCKQNQKALQALQYIGS